MVFRVSTVCIYCWWDKRREEKRLSSRRQRFLTLGESCHWLSPEGKVTGIMMVEESTLHTPHPSSHLLPCTVSSPPHPSSPAHESLSHPSSPLLPGTRLPLSPLLMLLTPSFLSFIYSPFLLLTHTHSSTPSPSLFLTPPNPRNGGESPHPDRNRMFISVLWICLTVTYGFTCLCLEIFARVCVCTCLCVYLCVHARVCVIMLVCVRAYVMMTDDGVSTPLLLRARGRDNSLLLE